MEAKYHAKCLVSLYNWARPLKTGTCKAVEHSGPNLDELAFAELITYIEERLDSEDLALLNMVKLTIIFRTKLESPNQACLTIAQLIVFNSILREHGTTSRNRHTRAKECPVPIYTSLKIHGMTRDKSLIEAFFKLGLCISYHDRLLSLSSDIANSVIARYESEDVACPSEPRTGFFTTAAVDNIDHNPCSTSSHDTFHSTAISLVQHPTNQNRRECREVDSFDPIIAGSKKILHLPSSFRNVPPVVYHVVNFMLYQLIPICKLKQRQPINGELRRSIGSNTFKIIFSERILVRMMSWAAYRASKTSHQPTNVLSLLFFHCS